MPHQGARRRTAPESSSPHQGARRECSSPNQGAHRRTRDLVGHTRGFLSPQQKAHAREFAASPESLPPCKRAHHRARELVAAPESLSPNQSARHRAKELVAAPKRAAPKGLINKAENSAPQQRVCRFSRARRCTRERAHSCTRELNDAQENSSLGSTRGFVAAQEDSARAAQEAYRWAALEGSSLHKRTHRAPHKRAYRWAAQEGSSSHKRAHRHTIGLITGQHKRARRCRLIAAQEDSSLHKRARLRTRGSSLGSTRGLVAAQEGSSQARGLVAGQQESLSTH